MLTPLQFFLWMTCVKSRVTAPSAITNTEFQSEFPGSSHRSSWAWENNKFDWWTYGNLYCMFGPIKLQERQMTICRLPPSIPWHVSQWCSERSFFLTTSQASPSINASVSTVRSSFISWRSASMIMDTHLHTNCLPKRMQQRSIGSSLPPMTLGALSQPFSEPVSWQSSRGWPVHQMLSWKCLASKTAMHFDHLYGLGHPLQGPEAAMKSPFDHKICASGWHPKQLHSQFLFLAGFEHSRMTGPTAGNWDPLRWEGHTASHLRPQRQEFVLSALSFSLPDYSLPIPNR